MSIMSCVKLLSKSQFSPILIQFNPIFFLNQTILSIFKLKLHLNFKGYNNDIFIKNDIFFKIF